METLTQAEYRAINALGSTDIKVLLENPYLFKNKVKKEPTDNLILGSLIHTLILEPNIEETQWQKSDLMRYGPDFSTLGMVHRLRKMT